VQEGAGLVSILECGDTLTSGSPSFTIDGPASELPNRYEIWWTDIGPNAPDSDWIDEKGAVVLGTFPGGMGSYSNFPTDGRPVWLRLRCLPDGLSSEPGNWVEADLCQVTSHTATAEHVVNQEIQPFNFVFEGHGGQVAPYELDEVYCLETLDLTGPGSFDAAPNNAYIIAPNLTGGIYLPDGYDCTKTNIMMLGQTSPGGLYFHGGDASQNNGLFRVRGASQMYMHMRWHNGEPFGNGTSFDTIGVFEPNFIMASCSAHFGNDEVVSVNNERDVTIQDSLIGPGLHQLNPDGSIDMASRGSLLEGVRLVAVRTLYPNNNIRNPRGEDMVNSEFRELVTFDGTRAIQLRASGRNSTINVVRCWEVKGPTSNAGNDFSVEEDNGFTISLFEEDNFVLEDFQDDCDQGVPVEWFDNNGGGTPRAGIFVNTPFNCPRIYELDVCDVIPWVTVNCGAGGGVVNNRSDFDQVAIDRMINGVDYRATQTGPLPNMVVRPDYPNIWDLSKPDKISDATKVQCGLDPATHQDTTQTFTNGGARNDFLAIIHAFYNVDIMNPVL
jgi:hypothetical protein